MLYRLFTHDAWANGEALHSLRAMDPPPEAAVRWLAHIAGAQEVWWGRLQEQVVPGVVWPDYTLQETAVVLATMAERWKTLLAELGPGDLSRPMRYANSRGEWFENTVSDVLIHLSLHGVHHRGQIASAVRAAGGTPAVTDFIHAVRTGALG